MYNFIIIAILFVYFVSVRCDVTDQSEGVNDIDKRYAAAESFKLQEDIKSLNDSSELIKDLKREHENIEKELEQSVENTKLNDLIKKRDELLVKIASISKTLRIEHDIAFPELKDQPIIIIAKNKDDNKLIASQLAHIDGFEDFINNIQSPCNILENLRIKSLDSTKNDMKDIFVMEQKTLDSMGIKERLNYDRNMIEHYELIMQEIEKGIESVNNEIQSSWKYY